MVEVVEEAVVGEAGEEAEAGAGAGVEAEEAEVRNVWDQSLFLRHSCFTEQYRSDPT